MKRKLSCFCIVLLITALLSNVVVYAANPAVDANAFAKRLESMELVAENDNLGLYMDKSNTEFGVKVKNTGDIWYSNLADRQSIQDLTAQRLLGTIISIVYYDGTGVKLSMDNLNNSVEDNLFKVKEIKNGVRVEYTLKNKVDIQVGGRVKLPEYKGRKGIEYDVVEDTGDSYGMMEVNSSNYDTIYIKKDEMMKIVQDQVFFIPVEFSLDGQELIATVPCGEVKHPDNYPLSEIKLLQYFGAAHYNEKGYMFLPDGSGALIDLSKSMSSSIVYKDLYGQDYSNLPNEKLVIQEPGIMPVYGLKTGNKAFMAVIEDGDAVASIAAEIGNYTHDYNNVSATFKVMPLGTITLTGAANPINTAVYQARMYKGDIRVRYSFFNGEDADYVGMARKFGNYLVKKYNMKKIEASENIPLNFEVLGAIKKVKSVLGFPMKLTEPLTTFKQAGEMVDELQKGGIDNINLKYTGWFNGGINHSMPTSVKPIRALGGKSGFKKLLSAMNEKNVKVYPEVIFQRVFDGNVFNFIKSRDSVRTLAQKITKVFPFSFVDYGKDFRADGSWILNPNSLNRVVGKFLGSYEKLDNKAFAVKDLGTEINSNFYNKKITDRQQSKELVEKELKRIKDAGFDLMMTTANAYALPYARTVLNAPVDSSKYNLVSESVPFFQIALHGYIDYTGEPVNLAQDYETTILRSIETGASPYYSLMYKDSSIVKNTQFTNLYSNNFGDWKDDLLSVYDKMNSVLKDVQDKVIVDHKKLVEGVYQTTYENGKAVVVNYNKDKVNVNGTQVEGRSYAILEGVEVE